jgi:hypothetical protein
MAPDPFVPEVFTPVKLITVIDEAALWDSVAVTVMLLTAEAAKARQTPCAALSVCTTP